MVSEAVALGQARRARVRTVAALLPCLEPVERLPVIAGEIDYATRANPGDAWRATVIVATAPYMSDEQLQASLRSSSGLKDDSARASALIGLARRLPEQLVDEALEFESIIDWPGHKCEFVATLAHDRPEPKRTQILNKAVLTLDESLRHGHALSDAAAQIASMLTGPKRDQVLQLCLDTLRNWAWLSGVSHVGPLMPLWSSEQRRQALEVLRGFIEDDERRESDDELSEVSRLLTRASFVELQWTFLPETLENPTEAIGKLAHSLAEIEVDPRKDILRSSRAEAIARLARGLDLEARQELAECAFELVALELRRQDRSTDLAETLAAVAMIGDAALIGRVLGEATAIADHDARARALQALGPQVAELEDRARCLAWCDALRACAKRTRASLLSDLNALSSTPRAIAGHDMRGEIQSALIDCVVAWP